MKTLLMILAGVSMMNKAVASQPGACDIFNPFVDSTITLDPQSCSEDEEARVKLFEEKGGAVCAQYNYEKQQYEVYRHSHDSNEENLKLFVTIVPKG